VRSSSTSATPGVARDRVTNADVDASSTADAGHGSGRPADRGADPAPVGLAWEDDDHLTRRPPARTARPVTRGTASAAAGPRRTRTRRRLGARHPSPVPGVGGPRPGQPGPVHAAGPGRRPADPGRLHRRLQHRRDTCHDHRECATARRDRRPRCGATTPVAPAAVRARRTPASDRRNRRDLPVPGRARPAGGGAGRASGGRLRRLGETSAYPALGSAVCPGHPGPARRRSAGGQCAAGGVAGPAHRRRGRAPAGPHQRRYAHRLTGALVG